MLIFVCYNLEQYKDYERALTFVLFYDKELIYVRFCFLYWKS